ncbi:beta-lactamase family protein, partial [Shewanella sp. SG41-4]|uniref:serine hydrolase domain-containing protein n=1 Tax=Shewanella sp. SG41-4 TaxID=2760976 RepID=UPI0016048D60
MTKQKIPGLQLVIVQNNKIIKTNSYGLANIEDAVPVDNETLFSINSITKAFTGIAVMQLVEDGKLDISKEISNYLPNLPVTWQDRTIKQLMTHTSGLPEILANDVGKLISDKGPDAAWELVQTLPNEFVAGSKFEYNQTNYIVIGKIIEKITNQPFVDFIRENQLQKVDMERTQYAGFSNLNNVIKHSARRYTYYDNQQLSNINTEEYSSILYPAVGMSSTATELARWIIALQSNMLLKEKSSIEELWRPALLNNGHTQGFNKLLNGYALGWPVVVREQHPAVAPSGGNRSAFFIYPEDKLSIVVLTNLMGGIPSQFIDDIASFYIPEMKKENGFGLPASIRVLFHKLEKNGYDKAIGVAESLQRKEEIKLNESDINNFGYWLVGQDKIQQALQVFILNTELFPESANAFDSVAETYWQLNNIEQAISGY